MSRLRGRQDNQAAAGLFYAAPFASRPDDHIGVGVARTDYNDRAAEAIGLANPGAALAVPATRRGAEQWSNRHAILLEPS